MLAALPPQCSHYTSLLLAFSSRTEAVIPVFLTVPILFRNYNSWQQGPVPTASHRLPWLRACHLWAGALQQLQERSFRQQGSSVQLDSAGKLFPWVSLSAGLTQKGAVFHTSLTIPKQQTLTVITKYWLLIHISQTSALSPKLALAGFVVTVATKNLEDWPHTVHTVVDRDAWWPTTAALARLVFLCPLPVLRVCAICSCFYVLTCCLVPKAGQVGGQEVLQWKAEPAEAGKINKKLKWSPSQQNKWETDGRCMVRGRCLFSLVSKADCAFHLGWASLPNSVVADFILWPYSNT